MEVSKPQPDSAEDSIDDNFDDFGFKFLCDDVDSSKSTLSSTSNSSSSESAPYSRYAGNVKPINGFWVIKESPPIRELKEPRLSSLSSQKSGSYPGKSELKGGYRKDTRYVPARPHFRHFVEHSIQSGNIGRKVCETKLGVHEKKESIYFQKPWIGELKVRESPNLEVVYDTNKTCTQGSSRKSDLFESQMVESLVENSRVDAGMSEPGMELVKGEPEGTRVNNVHNYSWQFSPRDPRINKELLHNDGTASHKSPMKHSPRDPRISHDQKVKIPPCKTELHDIKKYSPRDPRIKRFHVTERPNMGQSSEDAHVSVSCNLPELRNSEGSTQRTTYNVEWEEEGQGQGEKYETLESQKTDKENDDKCISGSCHDQNQSPSLTKLKICRVAHSKNMYVSSFCQETSPPRGVEKVDGGLEAENGEPPRSVEKVDGDLEAENEVRMAIEGPKHDLPSENDTCKFNEMAERLAKLGEKYCQAKVVVRKLQDFDIHKLTNATVDTGSHGHFQSTVDPQVSESLSQEKVVAISKLHKKGKRRGPRLRKELVLFSKTIPARSIEDEENSYQYVILPSDYITPAVKPNKSDLKGDEYIQSCQREKDIISDIATSSIDSVKEELRHDQRPRELLVDGEFAGAGDSVQASPGNVKATSPDLDTLNCIKDPHIDRNLSVEEENCRRYNDTLSTEPSLLPSAQCPNDSDEKDYERASINISSDVGNNLSINISEDVVINNLEQESETNVRLLSQVELETRDQIPLTESLIGKGMGIVDENNLIRRTQQVEEKEIDTGESLDKETQCASWQEKGNMSKNVKTTEIEKSSCENNEIEREASSLKDVDQSHKDDTHERIVEEIQTAFQVNEKQVESDVGKLKEQSKLPTPALSFLPPSGDPLLQDSSIQKSNKRHHLEIATADDHLKGAGGGKLVDSSGLEITSPGQVSVVEHLPYKKFRIDGDTILQQEGKSEVGTISQSASTGYTTMDKKLGFYHKKYNRTKLKLPIGTKYLKNQCMDGGKCTSKPVSSRANLNARKVHSVSETTPTKEITIKGKPHSPEDSISPVLDPVVAIEKLRYKLFAEAGVDLSKPSSSLYSGKFQRRLKKKSENEFQHENKTNFSTVSRVLKFENASRLNNEKLSDPESQACVREKLGISRNVCEKGHTDAVKTVGEVQSFGNAQSPKAVQIDHKAFHYQRKYNIGDARKAEVQIEKRKVAEKNMKQSKKAKLSLLAQKLTLRSVSKTTRVGYSKDGFVEKKIVRKKKPDEVECQISSSYGEETTEQPIADNVETKKEMSRNEINRNNFAQVKKGKGKSVPENHSKENASINMKDMLLPVGTLQFEEGSSKSICVQHESESNDSSMEFNNHSKMNELAEAESKKQPEELKEPNCIITEESDNVGQAENTIQVNIKTGNADIGALECDEKEQCKGDLDESDKKSSDKRESIPDPRKHSKPKQRPAKCVVCGHVFKTKELLKKHHPCRIKQTRTWSQKALRSRPNRVRKEPLPVLENKSKTSKKPRLLEGSMAHKKSKFKVVKGKTRRKVLQVIRELMEKRKPLHLPHMHILCEQLPENEQFLFQLGLLRKERTVVDDKTCLSPPISAVIVKTDAVAVEDLKTSPSYFHDTKLEEGYSICEDEKSFPPILEKISSEFSKELSPSLTGITTVGVPECLDPPILEPILVPETFSTNQESSVASNLRNMTSDSPSAKQLTERHFTDFIEEMPETVKEKIDILKEKGSSECKLSAASFSKMKSMIKAVKSPNHSMSKSIRRHFTDAISDTEVSPSMSNTVCPLNADVAEENLYLREIPSGEITFAHIRNMLTLERERKFSKHSLMKLKKDLAVLLTSVKSKSRCAEKESYDDEHNNDPDRTSTVTTARNLTVSFVSVEEHSSLEKINSSFETPFKETGLSLEEGFSEINDLRDPTISAHLGEIGKLKVTDQEIQSRSCITDNIMGMLTSLEEKGNFAENMKNVLQLLAADLGIQFSEIIQGGNLNKEHEERQQDNKQVAVTAEGYRSDIDEYYSDLEIVGHPTADDSEPSLELLNSVSVKSERGNQPKNDLDQEVPEDSSFVSCEKFNRAGDNDIDRGLLSNAKDNEEDSLKEQVFDILKNMVNRVEDEEIKSIKFVDEVSRRAVVTFELVAGNHNNLHLSHQALSDMEQKDGRMIFASEAQIQNDSEGGKEGIREFGSLHEQLDDSKLVIEGRNEDDVSFATVSHSENDNQGDGFKEGLSVNDRTENSKEDRCLPDKELELVPSTVVSSRFHSEESVVRCEYHMETSKTQDKVCILETEYRDDDVLVHENKYLDKVYSAFQVMDGSEYFLEKSDSQSKKPVHHDKVKEKWCPYTGYAIETDDTNEDLVAEGENNCHYRASLSKKEHTDGHYNEACRRSKEDENKFVVIPDISSVHSKTVSNDEASREENEIFQANHSAGDTFIKSKSFNYDSGIEPVSKVDSELKQTKNSVVSSKSLNIVKHDSMGRTQKDESRNVMSESGFCPRSEETGYRNDKTLVENHSSVAAVRSSEKLKKSEEEYVDNEVVLSRIIKQDILMVKNLSVFKSDEHTANAEDTAEPLYFDRQKDRRDEWYQKDQDVTNLIQYKILHDQQMNHLSSTDKGPVETDVAGEEQNASLLHKNSIHAISNSSYVEYKSMTASDRDDKKEDYVTKPCNTTVTAVGTHESEAGHEFISQVVEERNVLHIPLGIGLDEVEKEDLTMVKGIVSVDEQVNASVTENSHDYSENHNEDDSKSASSLETNSNQTVNASKIGKPNSTLHISKFQLELGERSSPVALRNVIVGEHPISRGDHEMEYDNNAMKADYVEWELKLSSEESQHHQKVLDEHVAKDNLITDDSQSVSGIEQSQIPFFETSSTLKTSIATASDVTATEAASYCSKETLRNNVEQNANIGGESAKAETVINEVSCYERKTEFNETVSEGRYTTESDVKGGKEAPAWSKDTDNMETKSLYSFTFDRFVTNRYEPEAESFHAKCQRPEELKNNEQREDSSDAYGAVKEVITFSGNDKDLIISSCDQQSFQVAVRSEKVLPCFVNIDSEVEVKEKNQPNVTYESHGSSLTNQDETSSERDTGQQKLYTRGIDSVASASHCEKDEIVTFNVDSNKMCCLYSGDISVQSPVVKEPEQYDDNGCFDLNNKQIETSKEKLTEHEAGTKKHKSYTSFCQDSVVGEDSLGQTSKAPNDDFNHAVPNIDSHGENLHVDLILHQGMEQVDKDTDIVGDSYFVSYNDVPNSSHKPVICDSITSDVSEEVNDSCDIVSDSNFIAEECHHTAGTVKSDSAGTDTGSGATNEHKYQTDTTLNDSLKNEQDFGLTDVFKIPKQEIIKESDPINPEVGNTKYKLNTSNSVDDETVVEREYTTIQEPKDMYDIVVNADPVEEINTTRLKHCQTGLITKCDKTLLLKKDCDVQSNEEFHIKPIVPELLLSSDLPYPVSFSSLEINVGHATKDPSTELDDISSSDDEIKKSSTQYIVETLIGSESPDFPEHECCGTHQYSYHFEGSSMFQNVQQQATDAAQEVDNNVTSENEVNSQHESSDSEEIQKMLS